MSVYELTQKYYDDITEKAKKDFKDHVATFEKLSDRVSILNWKEPGTYFYSVRYLMDGRNLLISGDLGCAVFELTWDATPASFKTINPHYFAEKLMAFSRDKYVISDDILEAEVDDYFKNLVSENDRLEDDDELKDIMNELKAQNTESDLVGYLNNSTCLEVVSEHDPDCYETLYNLGQVLNANLVYYLVGLKLAAEQLEKQA